MRFLIYGAGVLGSLYAARLKEAGHDVSLLARGSRLAELQAHGIVLVEDGTGRQTTHQVDLVDRLAPDDAYDYVLVLMRKNQAAGVLPALAASRRTPNVVFMTNNAAGPDAYIKALGRERVMLGFPNAGGAKEGHTVHYLQNGGGTFGELEGSMSPRLKALTAALDAAGLKTETSPNIDAWLKTHVALIIPIAGGILMAGGSVRTLVQTPGGLRLVIQAMRESVRCLKAQGVPILPAKLKLLTTWVPTPFLVSMLRKAWSTERAELAMARHAMSAQDEMAHLAAELQALVKPAGLPTPALDRLLSHLIPAHRVTA